MARVWGGGGGGGCHGKWNMRVRVYDEKRCKQESNETRSQQSESLLVSRMTPVHCIGHKDDKLRENPAGAAALRCA